MTGGTTSNPGDRNLNPDTLSFRALVVEDFDTHDRDILSQGFCAVFGIGSATGAWGCALASSGFR